MTKRRVLLALALGSVVLVVFGGFEAGRLAAQGGGAALARPSTSDWAFVSGSDLRVMGLGETMYTDDTKKVAVEAKRVPAAGGAYLFITPDGTIASVEGPRNYEMLQVGFNDGTVLRVRYSPASGLTWYSAGGAWTLVTEPGGAQPATGDYDVQIALTPQNAWYATRIERVSGASWIITPTYEWQVIPEPEDAAPAAPAAGASAAPATPPGRKPE
jgi:hypothetical protein